MAKKFEELRSKMSPEARTRSKALYDQHLKAMPLAELRGLSQEALAKILGVRQSSIPSRYNYPP
jgi:DNA-directed RNA polymerase specialized sigma24 family protein